MSDLSRNDEVHVLNCILKHLKSTENYLPKATYEPNGPSTAPDFHLDFDTYKINLEVTISGDGFIFTPEASLEAREVVERSSARMLGKLKSRIASWITPSESIIIAFLTHIPVRQRGRLALKIADELEQLYGNGTLCLNTKIKRDFQTTDAIVPTISMEVQLTNFYAGKQEYSPLKAILAGSLQSPIPVVQSSLSLQAQYILRDRIEKKVAKLSGIQGPKWLAILNTHPLLDLQLYKTGLKELNKDGFPHNFDKLFLVHEGNVFEL